MALGRFEDGKCYGKGSHGILAIDNRNFFSADDMAEMLHLGFDG